MSITVYDFTSKTIKGENQPLADYRGKVLLVVNTASKCGLTPQYRGLEDLYRKYKEQGLVILGYPCNQFAGQEPAGEAQIEEFCQLNYGVSFPMFAKIDVNGDAADPVFRFLKQQAPGILNSQKIKWNFTKFLIGRDGRVIKRFAPATTPEKLEQDIQKALSALSAS